MKSKNLLRVIAILPIILLFSISYCFATVASTPSCFRLYAGGNGRPTGFYKVETDSGAYAPVIKIMQMTGNNGTEITEDENTAIYCLKNGVGFGTGSFGNTTKEYTQYFDLRDPAFVETTDSTVRTYRNVLPTNADNYNKMMWILNNLAMAKNSDSINELLNEAGISVNLLRNYKITGMSEADIKKDVIEVVQQAAIWYYTNMENATAYPRYHPTSQGQFYISSSSTGTDQALYSINNKLVQVDIDEEPSTLLFKYLIQRANTEVSNGYTYEDDPFNPISFESSNAVNVISGSNYVIGPYKFNVDDKASYSIDVTITDGTNELTGVRLVGEDRTTELTGSSYKDKIINNKNKNFYIVLPTTTSVGTIEINITGYTNQRLLTYWSVPANEISLNQPVVVINDSQVPFNASSNVRINKSQFDLALRKFITSITSNGTTTEITDRIPTFGQAELTALARETAPLDSGTTLSKSHKKTPREVKKDDIVTYTIRVYNEGQIAGKPTKITDYLPAGLKLTESSTINTTYGWTADPSNSQIVYTEYTATQDDLDPFDIAPADGVYKIDYIDVQIQCTVIADTTNIDTRLKNIAEITTASQEDDRDSDVGSISITDINGYSPEAPTGGKGVQDDDDYEDLVITGRYFDLALRKYITAVNDETITNRIPQVDTTPLTERTATTANYNHRKSPVSVADGDIVTYTIRIYNEGQVDGFADEITDHLPPELRFPLVTSENEKEVSAANFNAERGWTLDSSDQTNRTVKTTYLSNVDADNKILGFVNKTTPDYKEVQIKCVVKEDAAPQKEITNIAEITRSSNELGLADRDNRESATLPSDNDLPNYKGTSGETDLTKITFYKGQEDDDDFEKVILQVFDLALRKFITGVNENNITSRIPQVDTSKYGTVVDGKTVTTFDYNHSKEPLAVEQNDIITYTIRVYNEGTQDGYAEEIKDDIPVGLEFLPNNEINTNYEWVMLDANGNTTEDISKAKSIVTDYRSKAKESASRENLIKAFDKDTMSTVGPKYVDVLVAFKVTTPNTSDRIIINSAQVSDDADKDGNEVNDIDSIPNNMELENPKEDDEDIEKLYVKYFDLALRKWVTTAIVIEDGTQKEMDTGHYAEQEPEPVVKVEVNKKRIDNTVIKFRYKIRITNEGEIPGYATEISDYIPQGLKFNQADNPNWSVKGDKIITNQLKDTLLNPGDQAFVDLTLTWINGEDNMGVMTNWAEISEDKNDSDTPDIDSIPNNKKEGEDDFDYAPVALTVVAGSEPTYIALTTSILAILGVGVVLIKKYVI